MKYITSGATLNTSCTDTSDADGDLLNACEESFIQSTSPDGPTPSWTTKMGTTSDPLNYDSDGDGFLDGLQFIYSRGGTQGMDYNSHQAEILGYRMEDLITQHRNPRNPAGSSSYDGTFQSVGTIGTSQSCYQYQQNTLPLLTT